MWVQTLPDPRTHRTSSARRDGIHGPPAVSDLTATARDEPRASPRWARRINQLSAPTDSRRARRGSSPTKQCVSRKAAPPCTDGPRREHQDIVSRAMPPRTHYAKSGEVNIA